VKALLAAGANIHARSISGATPLHLAIGRTICSSLLETVEILAAAGADQNLLDGKGVSPIAKAREIGNEQLLRVLSKV
jgi:ankyrin repeat protein